MGGVGATWGRGLDGDRGYVGVGRGRLARGVGGGGRL